MAKQDISIPENRALSPHERDLVGFILTEGDDRARTFLPQIDKALVIARCGCGCASVDFSVDGVRPDRTAGLEQLGNDFEWRGPDGEMFAIFVFAHRDLLAGLEVWSVDGRETPTALPSTKELQRSWW